MDPWTRATLPPVALFAVWLGTCDLVRVLLQKEGDGAWLDRSSEYASGSPRWRAALGMYFQLSLALLFVAFAAAGGLRAAGGKARAPPHRPTATATVVAQTYLFVFGGFMLYDFVILRPMRLALQVHHLVCLVFHAYAAALSTSDGGFRYYFAAVVALEAGSAANNVWCLWPDASASVAVYAVGMWVSNPTACLLCVLGWLPRTSASRSGRAAAVCITLGLSAARHKFMLDNTVAGPFKAA